MEPWPAASNKTRAHLPSAVPPHKADQAVTSSSVQPSSSMSDLEHYASTGFAIDATLGGGAVEVSFLVKDQPRGRILPTRLIIEGVYRLSLQPPFELGVRSNAVPQPPVHAVPTPPESVVRYKVPAAPKVELETGPARSGLPWKL